MASSKKPKPYAMSVVGAFMSPSSHNEEDAASWISVSMIDFADKQPRRYFSSEKMEQLTVSIKEKGVLEPILVRPKENGRYEVVAGERRLRASQTAELEQVPCVVRELSDEESFEIAVIENLQRDDLNPVEETEAILDLLTVKLGQSREEVLAHFNLAAKRERTKQSTPIDSPELEAIESFFKTIGRFTPNSFRTNRLPLLNLPPDVFQAIAQGKIEYSKGRLIARVKNGKSRQNLLEATLTEGLSQREIQDRVKSSGPKKARASHTEKVIARTTSVLKEVKKSVVWRDDDKCRQLEHHLSEIERLMTD